MFYRATLFIGLATIMLNSSEARAQEIGNADQRCDTTYTYQLWDDEVVKCRLAAAADVDLAAHESDAKKQQTLRERIIEDYVRAAHGYVELGKPEKATILIKAARADLGLVQSGLSSANYQKLHDMIEAEAAKITPAP